MEQIITNIWNINALLGGIVLLLILLVLIVVSATALIGAIFAPFRRNDED